MTNIKDSLQMTHFRINSLTFIFQIFQVLEHPVERDKLATLQDLVSCCYENINFLINKQARLIQEQYP